MRLVLALLLLFALLPSQASAGPLIAAVTPWWMTASATAFVTTALTQIGTGLVLSAIANAIYRSNARGQTGPGLRNNTATVGETTPQTIMVGRYATRGNLVAPYMSHATRLLGTVGSSLPASKVGHGSYRTHIYDLSDHPITDLEAITVNGVTFNLSNDMSSDGSPYGVTPSSGRYHGKFYVKWYDGTQTVADPVLVRAYGNHPERPWSSAFVGKGVAYAIITFVLDTEIWQGEPNVLFTVKGAPLYDPRTATTGYTENPMVIAWNIMRGITMPDGQVYGLGVNADALPSDWWHVAMDDCDADRGDGNATFRCGYEIKIANPSLGGDVPLTILGILADSCAAEFCDMGGKWLVRVGSVALPAATVTDSDLMRTRSHSFDPFPAIDEIVNAVHASYPSSESGWETREAPPLYNSAYEAEDGGQRYIASLSLPAVWDDEQVQFLMHSGLKDARRHRQHVEAMPPDYAYLTPLDAITRTSVIHGYTSKVFEIGKLTLDTATGAVIVQHRERDPLDYDPGDFVPTDVRIPSTSVIDPVPVAVQGFGVTADAVTDDAGANRRPRLVLTWDSDEIGDATGLSWVVRVKATGAEVARGSYERLSDERLEVTEGILSNVEYEVQTRLIADTPTVATGWVAATTSDLRITGTDIANNAVTRQSIGYQNSELVISTSAVNYSDWIDFLPSPLVGTLDAPQNPVIFDLSFDLERLGATNGDPHDAADFYFIVRGQKTDLSTGFAVGSLVVPYFKFGSGLVGEKESVSFRFFNRSSVDNPYQYVKFRVEMGPRSFNGQNPIDPKVQLRYRSVLISQASR